VEEQSFIKKNRKKKPWALGLVEAVAVVVVCCQLQKPM
jgi:hypothetical protein